MTRRRKLVTLLVVLTAAAITLTSVLRETDRKTQYGMTAIRLQHGTVYVKARACDTACSGELWLSRNGDRCLPRDPAADYRATYDELLYAAEGDRLSVVGSPATVIEPTGAKWLSLALLPRGSRAADAPALRYILFGGHLPERNIPGEHVGLSPCIRAFGHAW